MRKKKTPVNLDKQQGRGLGILYYVHTLPKKKKVGLGTLADFALIQYTT